MNRIAALLSDLGGAELQVGAWRVTCVEKQSACTSHYCGVLDRCTREGSAVAHSTDEETHSSHHKPRTRLQAEPLDVDDVRYKSEKEELEQRGLAAATATSPASPSQVAQQPEAPGQAQQAVANLGSPGFPGAKIGAYRVLVDEIQERRKRVREAATQVLGVVWVGFGVRCG